MKTILAIAEEQVVSRQLQKKKKKSEIIACTWIWDFFSRTCSTHFMYRSKYNQDGPYDNLCQEHFVY